MAGLPAKKLAFTVSSHNREAEAAAPRRPFAPVDAAAPTSVMSTPLRSAIPPADEENRTPQAMQMPALKTPKTVSVPMQMAATPLPTPKAIIPMTAIASLQMAATVPSAVPALAQEDIEYSFEERRAGFLLPKAIYTHEC